MFQTASRSLIGGILLAGAVSVPAIAGGHHSAKRVYLVEQPTTTRVIQRRVILTTVQDDVEYAEVDDSESAADEAADRSLDAPNVAYTAERGIEYRGPASKELPRPRATSQTRAVPQARAATETIRYRVVEEPVRERVVYVREAAPVVRERVILREVPAQRVYLVKPKHSFFGH